MKIYVLFEEVSGHTGESKPVGTYSTLEKAKANISMAHRNYVESFDLDNPASKPVTICIE